MHATLSPTLTKTPLPAQMDVPVVRLEHISKSFGPVHANRDITLDIRAGCVKALLGENGAGKSTLMAILAGRSRQDAGTIYLDGEPVAFRSPKNALAAGIGMVYQHFTLVDSMTVTQNIFLGASRGVLHMQRMRDTVRALCAQYGLILDPDARISDLSMGERQRVEILKLLYRDCRVLILDEPTAVLTPPEITQLFDALRRMASEGKALVFISHKMGEVLSLAQEIDILRRGEIVDRFLREDIPGERELATRMIGHDLTTVRVDPVPPREPVLRLDEVSGVTVHDLTLDVNAGEIVAIAGVAGNGQRELVELVSGLRRPVQGRVTYAGDTPWEAFFASPPLRHGMVYIPEDRQGLATCPQLNLVDNVLLTNRHGLSRGPFIDHAAAKAATEAIIREYNVLPGNPAAPAKALSGGNLQKLVIGREFYREPTLIIAENPTQGLDIAATQEVWKRLLAARHHAGILLITSDLGEALTLAGRIAVMYRGRFMGVIDRHDEAGIARIGLLMAGIVE